MAIMTDTPEKGSPIKPSHDYHAEAHVLSGHLQRPINQKIEPQAPVTLNDRRGGHLTRYAEDVSIEGLISFTRGETRVSGARSLKNNGWVTLSTSILEGLNVFEIITADRVVSQVSTDHPYKDGHFPHVTFLGTQFKNLRVSGFPAVLTLNLGICGDRPAGDKSYFQDPNFLGAVKDQTDKIARANGLPKELKEQYDKKLAYIKQLISTAGAGDQGSHEPITCSLVQSIGEIPIPGVQTFGHILVIPEFGSVALGEIEVSEKMYEASKKPCVSFELTSVRMKLGCLGDGILAAAASKSNGQTAP
ncbi:MAG: hypothetical protein WAN76_12180 [Candidatus Sulfotelmatobacter sp.]